MLWKYSIIDPRVVVLNITFQLDHEAACCQYEVNYGYTSCLRAADRHAFLKFMIKQLAEQEGYMASFMPVPLDGLICGQYTAHV